MVQWWKRRAWLNNFFRSPNQAIRVKSQLSKLLWAISVHRSSQPSSKIFIRNWLLEKLHQVWCKLFHKYPSQILTKMSYIYTPLFHGNFFQNGSQWMFSFLFMHFPEKTLKSFLFTFIVSSPLTLLRGHIPKMSHVGDTKNSIKKGTIQKRVE